MLYFLRMPPNTSWIYLSPQLQYRRTTLTIIKIQFLSHSSTIPLYSCLCLRHVASRQYPTCINNSIVTRGVCSPLTDFLLPLPPIGDVYVLAKARQSPIMMMIGVKCPSLSLTHTHTRMTPQLKECVNNFGGVYLKRTWSRGEGLVVLVAVVVVVVVVTVAVVVAFHFFLFAVLVDAASLTSCCWSC